MDAEVPECGVHGHEHGSLLIRIAKQSKFMQTSATENTLSVNARHYSRPISAQPMKTYISTRMLAMIQLFSYEYAIAHVHDVILIRHPTLSVCPKWYANKTY